jgi:hypothetical protein
MEYSMRTNDMDGDDSFDPDSYVFLLVAAFLGSRENFCQALGDRVAVVRAKEKKKCFGPSSSS